MFAAIRRASSRASGFVCSFEHLAARLKNRHHGWWTENTSNLTVSVFRAAKQCASPEPFPQLASVLSCALTTANHVESYLRKARERQSGARVKSVRICHRLGKYEGANSATASGNYLIPSLLRAANQRDQQSKR